MKLWIYQGEGFKIYNLTMKCNCSDHDTHSFAHYFGDDAPRWVIAFKLWHMRKELRKFTKKEEANEDLGKSDRQNVSMLGGEWFFPV